ncbi:MAG: hypothetical protein CME62_06965 [Halobacteriovoraceae bacterium]|nr:hypothetical protein [Halobacteriovoraceae bacterium]
MKKNNIIIILTILFMNSALSSFESFPHSYSEKTPVFFALHGCKQNEQDLLKDAYLLDKAKDKVIFFAPRQRLTANVDKCWNWFMPYNQQNMPFSETRNLMHKLENFLRRHELKNNPVYLIGFSAGAATAMNFLACYPEKFAGIATHSALPYRVTDQVYDVNEVIAYGPKKASIDLIKDFSSCSQNKKDFYHKKMLFFHGTEDFRVTIKNFQALESQIIESYDYRDDQIFNQSVQMTKKVKHITPAKKYPYQVKTYKLPQDTLIQFFKIEGMKHSWSGGAVRIERNDPMGPEATDLILETFVKD